MTNHLLKEPHLQAIIQWQLNVNMSFGGNIQEIAVILFIITLKSYWAPLPSFLSMVPIQLDKG
jgi:hypothetical protein